MKSGSIFDNVLITDDEKYAEEFAEETWGKTKVSHLIHFYVMHIKSCFPVW